jgi:hypothetical protein
MAAGQVNTSSACAKYSVAAAVALCMTDLPVAGLQRMQPDAAVHLCQGHCNDAAARLRVRCVFGCPCASSTFHAMQACGQLSASSRRLTDFYELDINIRGFPSLAASLVSGSKH